MKNSGTWRPTKFIREGNHLIASRDPSEVAISSRLGADLVATWYEKAIKRHASGRLLDLGCGTVPLFDTYRPHVTEIVCVDWEKTPHTCDHVDYKADLSERLPFVDGSFNTIILSDVLEHIPEPNKLCCEMARVLCPGGTLLLTVPFLYWLHEAPYDYYRYTEFALRRFMELNGMEVLELRALGGAPEVLADILAKFLVGVPVIGVFTAIIIQWMCGTFVQLPMGRRISCGTGRYFPFGYSLIAKKVKNGTPVPMDC